MEVIDSPALAEPRVHALYCEGEYCREPDGEVRVYPILSVARAARLVLCRPCWEHENHHRHQRGKQLERPTHWLMRDWDKAQRYLEEAAGGPPRRRARHDSSLAH
jgi:hypothetical protein